MLLDAEQPRHLAHIALQIDAPPPSATVPMPDAMATIELCWAEEEEAGRLQKLASDGAGRHLTGPQWVHRSGTEDEMTHAADEAVRKGTSPKVCAACFCFANRGVMLYPW